MKKIILAVILSAAAIGATNSSKVIRKAVENALAMGMEDTNE